ncbi:MAG TPA: T9SS type A sorting domain-containing protein [Candidatus Cloacimonetes bacterium]|nr:T9SS type A sorting domain-containing protein [Candidatus Cloacimonadota bacterium]HEX37579.1 T9SS type A sorting domain-containing protein [Candidatus Cloacimonadota bacterium]
MKKLIVVVILNLISQFLIGQTIWQDDGIPVRQGVNIEWYRSGASLEDGSVVYVWSDTRRGDRDVWAQHVDINGNLLWGADGIMVNGEINRQEDPVVINTGDGGVIVTWIDFRNEDAGDVYAQKLDENGNLLWDTEGVPLCLAGDVQISLNIVNDANYGAYVIWIDSRNPGGVDIYGTHIDADGNIVSGWDVNGNPIAATNGAQDQHTFWEDGTGGAIVAWHDTREASNENLYMQRIASNGDLLWDFGGTLLCGATGTQSNVKMCPDGTGSFIFTWRDKRDDSDGDIRARRVDIDGNLLWIPAVVIYSGDEVQKDPRITESTDTGAFIVWDDYRNDPYSSDIYAQKTNVDGVLQWNADGLPLCTAPNDQLEPRLINDANGGCYFVWTDGRDGGHPYEDIYMQHVNDTGNIQWEANGKMICDAYGEQFSPLLRGDGNGKAYAIWGDNRTGSTGLYLQILDEAGTEYLAVNGKLIYYGLCGDAKHYSIFYDTDKSIILWEDSRSPYIGNQLYMQTLSADGSIGLVQNGEPITDATGSDQENVDAIYNIQEGELVAVWEENRTGFKQVYAQAVDDLCTSLWADSGLVLGESFGDEQNPKISSITTAKNTEYYAGWSDYRDFMNPGIFGQKIIDGIRQWDDAGFEIVNRDGQDKLTDIVGRYFIFQSGSWNDQNIYVKLIDENGSTAAGWPVDGLEICTAVGNQDNATGMMIPEGLLVVWEDNRDGLSIYGQIVTEDATTLWQADGLPLADYNNDQDAPVYIYHDNIYLVWEDFRNGVDFNVFGQAFESSTGTMLWNADAVPIVDITNDQSNPAIAFIDDVMFIPWQDFRNGSNADIYSQKVTVTGSLEWIDDLAICTAIKNQSGPLSVPFDDNFACCIWQDARSSGKADIYNIYAQKVEINEVSIDDEPGHQDLIFIHHYPNPISENVQFHIAEHAILPGTQLQIYNLKGQLVYSSELNSANSNYTWNLYDKDNKKVKNGVYFYKLSGQEIDQVSKLLIIR